MTQPFWPFPYRCKLPNRKCAVVFHDRMFGLCWMISFFFVFCFFSLQGAARYECLWWCVSVPNTVRLSCNCFVSVLIILFTYRRNNTLPSTAKKQKSSKPRCPSPKRYNHSPLYIQGVHSADTFFQSDLHKYICQKKEKQQYFAVGTVRTFIEPST